MRICELKQKDVINMCSCKSLGCPIDVEFCPKTGRILSIIVPGPGRLCCFWGKENECIIPWESICQIGDDIILVKLSDDKNSK
ncbi:MAG: YlmC/YmxH family sporulation protein [Blautia sp.]|nr:YlmC/YmxH family sporulation protein [Blautia sp.]